MLVVNISNSNVILTDHDGKRYAFHRNIPVEISPDVYNAIIQSKHIDATDIIPYQHPEIADEENIAEDKFYSEAPEEKKKRGRPRR